MKLAVPERLRSMQLPENVRPLALPTLVVFLALGMVVGGIAIASRRGSAAAPVCQNAGDIAPALALRTLAGEPDNLVLDQAIEENKLETALATLYYSTSLSDTARINYYINLGEKFAEAKQKDKARFAYNQASTALLLSDEPFDAFKANAYLTLGKAFAALGDRPAAEQNFDYAYTISRYSAYVPEAQRRFVLSNLASEYKGIAQDRKSDESTRAQSSLPNTLTPVDSPAQVVLPAAPLGDDVKAATAWRQRAAQRVINSMGSKGNAGQTDALKNLQDALRAEDDLHALAVENRLGQSPSVELRAALAKSNLEWQEMKARIAQQCFGVSLEPAWEKGLAGINTNVRQATANYYLLRREMAVNLADPVDAAQARVDLLREEMMAGKLGLNPGYPETRLINELAQATRERIDLREDGLYVAVLSQGGRGTLVITTADLWGRPAAMASAGLGMSFPTERPPQFTFVGTPAPTAIVSLATPGARSSATPAFPTPVYFATPTPSIPGLAQASGTPTQPGSPVRFPTPLIYGSQTPSPQGSQVAAASTPAFPTPVYFATPTPPTFPTPVYYPTPIPPSQSLPTATRPPAATPTPAYNYAVIYASGPVVQEETGNDNFHITGMVVDQNGILITSSQQKISWCCPEGDAIHPRPTIDVPNGRFDFFVGRGQFDLSVVDGGATTQPVTVNTDIDGTGYIEWQYTFQHTSMAINPYVTPSVTPTPTATGTAPPATATPPLPGAISLRIGLDPGWNFIGLPLSPVQQYTAASLETEIDSQVNSQGGGVSSVGSWNGSQITAYSGAINMGVGYFLNITGTNRVYWTMTGYPLVAPVPLQLSSAQKNSISIPYLAGSARTAAQVQSDIDSSAGAGTFVRLWRMRDGTGAWEYYGAPGGIASFTLLPDRGYLLEVSKSFTWSPWQSATPTATPTVTWTPTATATASPTPFDTYEPNNTFETAQPIAFDFPIISYVSYAGDKDYYTFPITGASQAAPQTIYLTLNNLPADYDLYLYTPQKTLLAFSASGGQLTEYITTTLTSSGGYYVEVQGAGPVYDGIKPYKLLLTRNPQ